MEEGKGGMEESKGGMERVMERDARGRRRGRVERNDVAREEWQLR